MTALIVGCGRMGKAIAFAMHKLGFGISIVEADSLSMNKALDALEELNIPVENENFSIQVALDNDPDIVISAATYNRNKEVAREAIYHHIPYCDLGGDTNTSEYIKEHAEIMGESVFTDLGLAPGLINIITEHKVKEMNGKAKTVFMRVGGLPLKTPNNTLKYALTWSPDGLRNEYSGMCRILRNNDIIEVPALSEIDHVPFGGYNSTYESFHTKGGAAHSLDTMKSMGVVNCEYKTIREFGHGKIINFLLNECKLEPKQFDNAILNACGTTDKDKVLMDIRINSECVFQKTIECDDKWTAMQKSTAFPTAAVASLIAQSEMPKKVIYNYLDIPFNRMCKQLEKIGGLPDLI